MTGARLRISRTALLPVLVLTLCVIPAAAAAPWGALLLLLPALAAAWVLRVGVDVGADGVTARSLAGSRHVPWNRIAGLRVGPRAALWLVTTEGTQVRLPALRVRDLPRLAAASDGRIPAP
jgi:PH (Pleckstrin Homology) domain-containing protein